MSDSAYGKSVVEHAQAAVAGWEFDGLSIYHSFFDDGFRLCAPQLWALLVRRSAPEAVPRAAPRVAARLPRLSLPWG